MHVWQLCGKIVKRSLPRAMASIELYLRICSQMLCNLAQQALVCGLLLDRVVQMITADAIGGFERRRGLHDIDDARVPAADDERRRLLANQ